MAKGSTIFLNNKKNNSFPVVNALLTAFITIGIVFVFMPCISSEGVYFADFIDFKVFIVILSILTSFIAGALSYIKKIVCNIIFLIIFFALLLVVLRSVIIGFEGTVDRLAELWNIKYEDAVTIFDVNSGTADIQNFNLFSIIAVTFAIWYFVNVKSAVKLGIIILAALSVGSIFGINIFIPSAILLSGWLMVWFSMVSDIIRLNHIIWAAVCFLTVLGIYFNISTDNIDAIDNIHKSITEGVEKIRYGNDSLPKGNLRKARNMFESSDERLFVKTDYGKTMYLKGFVGSVFKEGKWDNFPKSVYRGKNQGIYDWLEENGLVPMSQYKSYIALCSNTNGFQEVSAEVENIGADRRYVYLPYSFDSLDCFGEKYNNDYQVISEEFFGCGSYSFTEKSQNLPSELLQNEGWIKNPSSNEQKKYIDTEKIYRSFVYENYIDIPKEYNQIIDNLFWQENGSWDINKKSFNIYETTDHIRQVLNDNLALRAIPKKIPDDADPVKYTLENSKEGNSPFFATVSVMAYRKAGIPARYAEGYIISENEQLENEEGVTLTSENGHAWAEVYFDGVGWLPVDNTPGYYFDAYSLQQMLITSEALQKTGDEDLPENQILDSDFGGLGNAKEIIKTAAFTLLAFLGTVTLALLLIIFILIMLEIYRTLKKKRYYNLYNSKNEKEKTIFVYNKITDALWLLSIKATLGKDSDRTDKELTEKFGVFDRNEYNRIHSLAEKTVYGDIELQPHEQRTMVNFLYKLLAQGYKADLRTKLKFRYKLY